ncbi:membrane protein [Endomicrobiia bacterium]|nr:membrane protein [Endomicrobiia bacterium]GHT75521.1 membrane protein [Endomicrobiia bacterium]
MKKIREIKGEIKERISVLFIVHGQESPFKINISVLFLCAFIILWTTATIWPRYFAGKYFGYIKTKADNKIMRIKLSLFANHLEKSKHLLEKAQINDEKNRLPLALNAKKSIIKESSWQNLGKCCPTPTQINVLAAILSGNLSKINYAELSKQTGNLYAQYKFMYRSYDVIIAHFMTVPCGRPCDGRISSCYGSRSHPAFHGKNFHDGLDIANTINTPIRCTANGKVTFSGRQHGYGNVIVIEHDHNYKTAYGHLSEKLVTAGTHVHKGQVIAKMGDTGTSTGPHVHYEVYFKGKTTDPKPYLADYLFAQSERNSYA